jgi:hypothetical protein
MEFIKNSGGPSYPNSSNAGFILSGGVHYAISTPWVTADLPFLKFSQVADQMTITRHGYPRQVLSRITDTNWTLAAISPVNLTPPGQPTITVTGLPAGSPDPQNTTYAYCVTAVDVHGNESFPSPFGARTGCIDIGTTQGTVSLVWTGVSGAAYYKVYKALPSPGGVVPSYGSALGFAGFANGSAFTDSNIVPDFSRTPPTADDPFVNSSITGYAISASTADWPVLATTLTVTDATGSGAELYPIFATNLVGGNSTIVGIYIRRGGSNYTAPTVTAAGGGTTFTATLSLSAASGNDPDVCGLFQQRQIYASSPNFPNTLWGSRPNLFPDFRSSNPVVDNDAYTFTIASQQVNDIVWLQSMPGGLVIGTNSGIVQLTGGSAAASSPLAVTPSNAVVVPQSYYGSADLHPIVIDYDILYVQAEGSLVRDLQYNFFVNIYTGTDITSFSSHFFYPNTISDWSYQDIPNKTVWAIRNDGVLLSLAYLKAQEILGWAQQSSQGAFESIAVVREGVTDAVYFSVIRNGQHCIERLCDRIFNQVDDAWCLDAALSTQPTFPNVTLTASGSSGTITLTAGSALFSGGSVGSVVRYLGSKATITVFTNSTHVTAVVNPNYAPFPTITLAGQTWRLDPLVSSLSGLSHLNGMSVMALVDGVAQGPFTVSGGSVTLTTPGTSVVVGLSFTAKLQTLYLDVGGELTIQGKRKRVTAASFRVKDTAGIKYGTSFSTLQSWRAKISSTDPIESWPYNVPGLFFGDQRIELDPSFNVTGSVCIQQDQPLPASVLAIIPEMAQGDTT